MHRRMHTHTHAHTSHADAHSNGHCTLFSLHSANLAQLQAKLQAANEKGGGQEAKLEQEENVSISGSSARLMIMQKLSRKNEVGAVV